MMMTGRLRWTGFLKSMDYCLALKCQCITSWITSIKWVFNFEGSPYQRWFISTSHTKGAIWWVWGIILYNYEWYSTLAGIPTFQTRAPCHLRPCRHFYVATKLLKHIVLFYVLFLSCNPLKMNYSDLTHLLQISLLRKFLLNCHNLR